MADQQVFIDTSSIKWEISENQPINGQPQNDPFTEVLNSEEFSSAFASPKKWPLNEPQKPNNCMKISAIHSAEDSTEQLIQLAPSKTTQINMATAFLTSKKHQWQPQSLWSAVSKLNWVITCPESGTTFYQIIAKYFEQFREIALEFGNVIRLEIVKYLLHNKNWIQVSKFEMLVNCILHSCLFSEVSSILTMSVQYLMCIFIIIALDKSLFGLSWDNNIHIHE